MAEPSNAASQEERPASRPAVKAADEAPSSIILISYPKIVFLYPTFLAAVAAAIYLSFAGPVVDAAARGQSTASILFLAVLAINLVVLGFDFPRTTSLTLFFLGAAIVMSLILLFEYYPEMLPRITAVLEKFRPLANASFYWSLAGILGAIFAVAYAVVHFDYWEVRPNELLHHHGFLSNLERFSAPHLRIDKEIGDVFEYLLLHSGRLILQPSNERRAIILDNVPFIERKEQAITRMLGALQVQLRSEPPG
ncbi:MAG TPA: hypothetical protein VMV10_00955 [Pirellulales bacterium]|nr:hypothetical protein [Pirellulales bacterium]